MDDLDHDDDIDDKIAVYDDSNAVDDDSNAAENDRNAAEEEGTGFDDNVSCIFGVDRVDYLSNQMSSLF